MLREWWEQSRLHRSHKMTSSIYKNKTGESEAQHIWKWCHFLLLLFSGQNDNDKSNVWLYQAFLTLLLTNVSDQNED